MVTGSSPMKEKFVALHMPSNSAGATKSTSIWRRWNRLTACQKRSLIVVLVLLVTTYAVGEQLHELHLKSKKIEKIKHKKHKNPKHKDNYNDPTDDNDPMYEEQPSYDGYAAEDKDDTENDFIKSEDDQYQIPNEDEIHQKPLDENINEQNQAQDGAKYQDHSAKSWRGNGVESAEQLAIKQAFQHAWKGYKQFAWGHDMLKPMSRRYEDWFSTQTDHMGLTLIDSLDVMVIMGLEEEFSEAREFVEKELSLAPDRDQINLFECTIRVLGGFLSTYHLTNDDLFKEKAIEIGDRLLPAITASKSSVPYSDVNLKKRQAHSPRWGSSSSTSEVTTIQMEFRILYHSNDLSFLTGDPKYEDYVYNVSKHISKLPGKLDGLVPMWISPESGQFNSKAGSTITLGARTDSYYEYLFKRWYQEKIPKYEFMLEDFKTAMKGVKKHLFGRTKPNNYLIVGEKIGNRFSPKMDHLVCFLPVMRNRAARNEKLAEIRIPTEPDIDSAGRSRNQSSSIDSSADRDILNGRSISPLEHISITPATTPDRIPSVSPTPPRRPNTAEVQSQRKRRNPCYFDGYNPMKATLKKKLRRRKLSKELDQLVDELDIDEGPPPSKLALTRTKYSEKKKIEQKKQEAIKAQEKEDALKQIFAITEF